MNAETRTCECCGSPVPPKKRTPYCQDRCYWTAWNKRTREARDFGKRRTPEQIRAEPYNCAIKPKTCRRCGAQYPLICYACYLETKKDVNKEGK